jgi:citronellol/citronellal dehydrogenase
MFQNGILSGKTVLITGGGSGIGLETARQMLHYGAEVYIASRKEERLTNALKELQPLGNCRAFQLDIRDQSRIEELAAFIKSESGQLDILINNAGGQFISPAEGISANGWLAVINTNLNGTWFMTQTMAKQFFLPSKSGCVINIIVDHYRGNPGMAHTGAARAGVDNLTKSLAVEWANKGIRINSIAPGIIYSTGLKQYPQELVEQVSKTIPVKRLGETKEVAELCVFLTQSNYITGETIYIDGASRLWGDVWEIE